MKLQPASRKEVKRMAFYCGICCVLEIFGLLVLSILGIGHFSLSVIFGALGGTLISIANFAMMCLMVQNAAGIQDQKLLKAKVQGSYNLRLLVQAAWVVAAFLISWISLIAAVIPLLFPTAVIYYLQMTGKLMKESNTPAVHREVVEDDDSSEDNLNSFEV